MTSITITYRDPIGLRPHPILAETPMLDPESAEFRMLWKSIKEHGLEEPLKITAAGDVADGRHRLVVARDLWKRHPDWRGLYPKGIPCVEVDEDDARGIAIRSLRDRRHYTSGQLAYALSGLLMDEFEASREAATRGLHRGLSGQYPAAAMKSLNAWAAEHGLGSRTLDQAIELRKLFAAHTEPRTLTDRDGVTEEEVTFQNFFERRLLADCGDRKPYGLGAILAGIKQVLIVESKRGTPQQHAGGKPTAAAVEKQLRLVNKVVDDSVQRWQYWDRLDEEAQAEHWDHVHQAAARIEPERAEKLAEYYLRLSRTFAKAAKRAGKEEV